jgi:hypothetical protein
VQISFPLINLFSYYSFSIPNETLSHAIGYFCLILHSSLTTEPSGRLPHFIIHPISYLFLLTLIFYDFQLDSGLLCFLQLQSEEQNMGFPSHSIGILSSLGKKKTFLLSDSYFFLSLFVFVHLFSNDCHIGFIFLLSTFLLPS